MMTLIVNGIRKEKKYLADNRDNGIVRLFFSCEIMKTWVNKSLDKLREFDLF